jgi:hypothetical protein
MTSPLYAFEITLQSQPAEATAGPPLADAWGTWPTLDVPNKELLASPMAIGFDAAFERLAAIERLYAEPDGSFVWTCSRTGDGAARTWWQVDGNTFLDEATFRLHAAARGLVGDGKTLRPS